MAPEPPLMADHQVKPRSSISGVLVLVRVILVLLLFKFNITVSSQSIIKTLPGFSGDLPVKMETGGLWITQVSQKPTLY
ncbi:unnamed protein product [Ilex paraguariensis]|uniref:Uncharacterized protein n=1 Tax=Ilex paraguariensis TaxID=185542 RepID=A0ABC8RJ12_9AQUA